jgi:isopenicillin N synthase-like dioxygenase
MVTATIVDGEVVFSTDADFQEAMKVGFFRIKAPADLNLEAGRHFARTFTSNPRYQQFGVLDVVNGYLQSEIVQTVRFALERDNWNKCHVDQKEVAGPPNFSPEVQELGHRINEIGVQVLRSILKRHHLPMDLWFEATAGCAHGEGSCFIKFNCYDPKLSSMPYGVGPHKDWGHVSLLDVTEPGLEAKIDGVWRSLFVEDGYLIVNFGYVLEKLLPGVTASEHRVITQKEKMRTSTVVFCDPRVGPYRDGVAPQEKVGYVYDWDAAQQKLVNGEPTTSFFGKLSALLYGENQKGK